MNPFELPGPQFLVLYAVYGAAVVGLLFVFRRFGEPDDGPRVDLSDPYLIAFLRGGPNEALRVATLSLVDRHALKVEGEELTTRRENVGAVRDPLEQAITEMFDTRAAARSVFSDPLCQTAAGRLGESLERLGLLPGSAERWARRARCAVAAAALWLVALNKIAIGVARNRPVGLLLALALLLTVGAIVIHDPRRTRRGESLLEDLRALFARLEWRARAQTLHPSRDAAEATLLAAVFGIALLPEAGWLHARNMYPKAVAARASSCGASCGSISSGGGSGCGGGCGGGGCGGGCGGCGS